MAELSISLSNVQNIKTVNIEGLGVFKVRRLGPGEEYDLSTKRRRLMKISQEMVKIKKKIDNVPGESEKEALALKNLDYINKLSDEITDIQKYELDAYKRCFTDDSNGEKTEKLINSLTDDERLKLYSMIFDTKVEEPKDEE